jgi:hypothetical protein
MAVVQDHAAVARARVGRRVVVPAQAGEHRREREAGTSHAAQR